MRLDSRATRSYFRAEHNMPIDPLQELRALLAAPNGASWASLCQRFLSEELLPLVAQEVSSRLNAWSDELRRLPPAWILQPNTNAAPFVRAASLDFSLWADLSFEGFASSFSALRWLELSHASEAVFASLPRELTYLNATQTTLSSLPILPETLMQLMLSKGQLALVTLDALPKALQRLSLSHNQIQTFHMRDASLPMLQSLSLASNPLSKEPLQALWHSESFPMLRSLDLSEVADAAEPLYYHSKGSPIGRRLQSLSLNGCGVTDEQLESLTRRGDTFPMLSELHLSQNPITEDGLSTLGKSLLGKKLRSLSLGVNQDLVGFDLCLFPMLRSLSLRSDSSKPALSAESLRELPWDKLESISLCDLSLGDEVLEMLAEVPCHVSHLDLSGNQLTQKGLRRFLIECELGSVKSLSLAKNRLQSAVAFLAEYESAYRVEHLDLSSTNLDDVGLSALCDWLSALIDEGFGLRSLKLSDNQMTAEMCESLASCRGASRITELSLDGCGIDDARLQVLQGSPHLTQLQALSLCRNPTQDGLASLLLDDAGLRLERLSLSDATETRALCRRMLPRLMRPISLTLSDEVEQRV
jgi:Leucine-rich repeat (LRR) protein